MRQVIIASKIALTRLYCGDGLPTPSAAKMRLATRSRPLSDRVFLGSQWNRNHDPDGIAWTWEGRGQLLRLVPTKAE